jgi:hypothetical protein
MPLTITTPYGTVTIHPTVVAVSGTGAQFYDWANRPGAAWPCSTLRHYGQVVAWFDANGLVDLQGYNADADDGYDTSDIAGDELSAWTSDVLAGCLPADHPAYPVAVGQFADAER